MKTISKEQLIQMLKDKTKRGARPVGITANTDARLPKKSGFAGTRKISMINGFFNANYENSVNNKLDRLGFERTFQAGERKWGEHDNGLIMKDGRYYVQIKVEHQGETQYLCDGKKIPFEKIVEFLKGKEEFVKVRSYSIDSIKQIRIDGEEYNVT